MLVCGLYMAFGLRKVVETAISQGTHHDHWVSSETITIIVSDLDIAVNSASSKSVCPGASTYPVTPEFNAFKKALGFLEAVTSAPASPAAMPLSPGRLQCRPSPASGIKITPLGLNSLAGPQYPRHPRPDRPPLSPRLIQTDSLWLYNSLETGTADANQFP